MRDVLVVQLISAIGYFALELSCLLFIVAVDYVDINPTYSHPASNNTSVCYRGRTQLWQSLRLCASCYQGRNHGFKVGGSESPEHCRRRSVSDIPIQSLSLLSIKSTTTIALLSETGTDR